MSSHPVVEAIRQFNAQHHALCRHVCWTYEEIKQCDAAKWRVVDQRDALRVSIDAALEAIEPDLAKRAFNTIPEPLREKAYMDGTDIWTRGFQQYSHGEGATRVINDETIRDELLDLRQRFIDRSLEAADAREAEGLQRAFNNDAVHLVLGYRNEGLRPLGPIFDKRLLEARHRYKDRLTRSRGLGSGTAFEDYYRAVVQIVQDFLASIDKANEPKDRKEPVADRTVEPAAAPAPALQACSEPQTADKAPPGAEDKPAPTAGPRMVVEVIDRQVVPDDTGNPAQELEQAFARTARRDEVRAVMEDAHARYDRELSERWKQPPPQPPKRKKGARHADLI